MKSINIKRIAAVAAGVAMVGSVMASGLAVTQQGEVTSLVSSIKANLDNAQVVVGTHGADISDGVQAAKIAAVLASVNYAAVSTGTVSIKDKSVVLETSAGATEQITSSSYPAELAVNASGYNGHYATNWLQSVTLTKDTLTQILGQKQISATVNGTSSTYLYEDRIILNNVDAKYDESSSSAYLGHGLFLNAQYGTGALEYRIYFSNGLPVGTGRSYTTIPEIDLLGRTTGIDYLTAQNQSMYIYSGTKSTMMTGDEVSTADSYKVRLDSVTQGSGNTYYAIYTATNPSGATESSSQLTTNGDYNFFANKVSVHVDYVGYDQSAAKGTTITRVTSGKQLLTDGAAFALDNAWTVKHIEVGGGTATGTLNYIALKYGSITAPPTFAGSVQTGLAQGVVLDGPKMSDGTPKFQMKLKGYGSTSNIVDTTTVTFDSIGSSGTGITPTHILRPTWTARDGSTQTLDATLPAYVVVPVSAAVNGSFNTNTNSRWMIVNDKVVYLKSVESTGSGTQYNVKFALGGVAGQEVTVGPFANASGASATFTYTSNVNPISCAVYLGSPAGLDLTNVTLAGGAATAVAATDSATATCDTFPDLVPIGVATQMTSNTGTPWMDLRYIQGGAGLIANATFEGSATELSKIWPLATVVAPAIAENVTVVFDSEAGTDGLTGLRAYLNLPQNITLYNQTKAAATVSVNQGASTTVYENSLYDVTPWSMELNGAVRGKLDVMVPESRRNAIFEISKAIGGNATAGTGTYTAAEGQTVGNVKVKSISCTASVTGSNLFSPTKTVQPESLVTTDASASASYQIVVGGPWVNSVAQGIAGNALTTSAAGASYLIADGNKLLVAGFTAADTASAADALVGLLKA